MLKIRRQSAQVTLMAGVLCLGMYGFSSAQSEHSGGSLPGCFVSDTVYHVVLNLKGDMLEIGYGALPLVSVHFTPLDDPGDVKGFGEKWWKSTKSSWQTTSTRHVWAGHPQVSDTVIRIVSEIASVDPVRIQRLLPERFDVELTGGFRLRIMTPAGNSAPKEFAEKWFEFKSRWSPFAHVTILEVLVSPEDAQTIYYGLEPGTPVVVSSADHAPGK